MDYFKKYIMTHFKLWWLYIIAIFSSLFGMFVSVMLVGRSLASLNINSRVNLILSTLLATLIGSSPIFCINYIAAKNNENGSVVIRTIINHLITIILFYPFIRFCLYWLIIDFRK